MLIRVVERIRQDQNIIAVALEPSDMLAMRDLAEHKHQGVIGALYEVVHRDEN